MSWTQSILDDEKHFPQTIGKRFPPTFMTTAKTILRRLFRVYAHIYHAHFDQICALGIEGESRRNKMNILSSVLKFSFSSLEHQLPPFPSFCG